MITKEIINSEEELDDLPEVELCESGTKEIEDILKETIFGQDEAIKIVARILLRAKAGLNPIGEPIGALLLYGLTGVGKTETAKTIAKLWFGDSNSERLIILNMSEYSEKHTIANIIGSPPGYVGGSEKSVLDHDIVNTGRTIILLDEFEKAHPQVAKFFLGAISESKAMARDGRNGNQPLFFNNTLFIFTSNAGSSDLSKAKENKSLGFVTSGSKPDLKSIGEKALKKYFPPEFLGRVETIMYESLCKKSYLKILDKFLWQLNLQVVMSNSPFVLITDVAKEYLIDSSLDTAYGGRGVKVKFRTDVVTVLSNFFMSGQLDIEKCLVIDYKNGKYIYKIMEIKRSPLPEPEPEIIPEPEPMLEWEDIPDIYDE
jgi:ATP-dependent Clp protease ATP-binding subunit ClpA